MENFLQANPRFRLRKMTLQDIPAIMAIEPQAFGTHHWTAANFIRELDNPIALYLVAESLESELLAYIGSWIVCDELHIVTLAVDPKARRQGLAEALLLALLDFALCQSIRAVTLEVRLSNLAAQELYRKYSFHRQGLRPNYYEDNKEPALLLWTEDLDTESFQEQFKANLEAYSKRQLLG